jgi:hypothetical protein
MQDVHVHCWTRVSPFVLRCILKDGRLKTRFEGVRSLAALDDLEARAEIEQKFYGYALDLPAEQRPVYGYLSAQPNGTATHGHLILDEYGCAAIRLKEKIKARTTFCIGDSLKSESAPLPYDEAALPENLDEIIPYVEAQFHGGVTLQDIAEVVFLVSRSAASLHALVSELAVYGIPGRIEIVG